MHLGLDIGTSSAKAVVVDKDLNVQAVFQYPYELLPNEQSSIKELAFQEVDRSIDFLLNEVQQFTDLANLESIGVSTAMHSLILLDEHFQALSEVIVWADMRSKAIFQKYQSSPIQEHVDDLCAAPFHPCLPILKIRFLQEENPELHQATHYYADVKSWLIYRLTGTLQMDYSVASATGLWRADQKNWSKEALQFCGITPEQLPVLVDTDYVFKDWKWNGEEYRVPLNIGASDGCLSNLYAYTISEAVANLTIGTSAALRTFVPNYQKRQNSALFCYYLTSDQWVLGGATNNAGGILKNLPESLPLVYEVQEASHLIPFRFGERCPIKCIDELFGFVGEKVPTDIDLASVIKESISFNVFWILQLIEAELDRHLSNIVLSGGMTRDETMKALLRNWIDGTIADQIHPEASALGAIILAMKSASLIAEFSDLVEELIPANSIIDSRNTVFYKKYTNYQIAVKQLLQNKT